ncbi:MAG: hypothetical protein AB7Q29_15585 [Vicinamibacterales bacterium]
MLPRRQTLAAAVAATILLAAMVWLSPDFGFTWDERFQQYYGEQIWDYYHGDLPRTAFDTSFGNQYLYGGLVEIVAVWAQHVVPLDAYVVRHGVNAVFGWAGIVLCGVLAGRMFSARAGWLAATLLTILPRYFGDAMNNPKDVPFAVATLAVLCVTLTIDWRRPRLSPARGALLAVAVASALNIRPLGLALLLYAAGVIGLAAAVSAWTSREPDRVTQLLRTCATLAIVAIVAIPAGTIVWPYAQSQPYLRPVAAFVTTSRLDWAKSFDVLFAGENLGAGSLPWFYVPLWLGMILPPVVLAGLAASWLVVKQGWQRAVPWAALVAFVATPVVAAIWRHATIYDGIRHLLFIVPPIVALAGIGWDAALRSRAAGVASVLLAIGLLEPVVFQVRNHPNQNVYFTPLMGGPRTAFARYDMDYWGNSMLQAVQWADRVARASGVPLAISGNPVQNVDADARRFRSLIPVARANPGYHLDVRLLRGPRDSLRDFASRADILYTVRTADGTPLSIVLPGPAFDQVADRLNLDPP